jgi:V/A-type H+/Na+-transporting ATPase subunit B
MPGDDITHPIPDLTGYITEGQIFVSRQLASAGIFPPINVQPSLSRLMGNGIGKGKTRADHKEVADQLFASYARGVDLRKLVAITGEDALTDNDKKYLRFAEGFEQKFINQGAADRSIEQSLSIAWALLSEFPRTELKRIRKEYIETYYGTQKMSELVA